MRHQREPRESVNDENFIHAKKSLGQNFLISSHALDTIVSAAQTTLDDIVVEVGPGKGALTAKLLEKAKHVIAIEKDDRLIPVLTEMFAEQISQGKFTLIHGDALEFNPKDHNLKAGEYKVIANIPYYITGSFFKKFFGETTQPNTIVVMVQKEVAERVVTRDNKESILSLSVKVYGTPKYISTVARGLFRPVPNVDSAILAVYDISKKSFENKVTEENFFEAVKNGFAHKRKKLLSNLLPVYSKEKLQSAFATLKMSEDTRAETLKLDDWLRMITELE